MMVTGEYHNKILMALYTCIMFACRFLHTHVNHILLHNGNRNTDRDYEAKQHFEWPHVSSQALLRDSSSHTLSLTYTLEVLRCLHPFSIVSIYALTQITWI